MTYNDFPILNDNEYYLLQTQYNAYPFDRNENAFKIFLSLQDCINLFYGTEKIFNFKIDKSLIEAKTTVQTILENLKTLFNFKSSNKNIQKNQNIFSITKQMIDCIKAFAEWTKFEKKEYYKKIAHNSAIDLLNSLNEILNAMEQSF